MRSPPRLLAAVAALAAAGSAGALEPEAMFEKVAPSVWIVRALDESERPLSLGSGVVTAPGKLITNCHVLARGKRIQVRKDNVTFAASLEHADVQRDLCQLSVRNFTAPAAALGSIKDLKIGQRVYAIGNPRGLELSMSEGIIASLRAISEDDAPLIQTTAAISRGSSGGGLFDREGRLIGITTFSARDSQNLNFAHPADWIAEVPARAAVQLAKHREASAPAAAPAAAAPATVAPAAESPVSGDELARLFAGRRDMQVSEPSGLDRLVFYANGIVDAEFTTVVRSGTHSLRPTAGHLCMQFAVRAGMRTIPFLNDCFTVARVSANRYKLKSTTGAFMVIGDM